MQFVCKRKCQYARSIYNVGETIEVDTIVKCPLCEGKGCDKCHKTGRVDPPHHFMPVENKEKPVTVVDAEPDKQSSEEVDAIEAIRKEFEERGIAFDRKWNLKKLQTELKKATKEGK